MKKQILLLQAFLISGFLVSCTPRTLNTGAESVHVYDYRTPKSCKFLGNITNQSVHSDLSFSSSAADLQKDDINYLKNEGSKLGANVVVLVSHTSYESTKKGYGKHPATITFNEHSIVGRAYRCPLGGVSGGEGSATHVQIKETSLI